jgi:hypothetical protein
VSTGTVAGIGGAAAGAAAAAVVLAGGDDPAVPTLTITPTPNGSGISDVTVFSFTAAGGGATDYTWEFGDGSTASGATVSHLYTREGTFQVIARASGANGQSATVSVTVGTLTGTWVTQAGPGLTFRLQMTQQGSSLTGDWIVEVAPGAPYTPNVSPLTGSVVSPRGVTLRQEGECQRTLDNATVDAALTSFTGAEVFRPGGPPGCGSQGTNPSQMYRRQ